MFKSFSFWREPGNSGQSLAELVIAIAVGSVMILAAITAVVPALKGSAQVVRAQMAASGARELMDNVRAWSRADWHDLSSLSKSSSSPYFLTITSSSFTTATGTEFIPSDGILSGLIGEWRFDEATGTLVLDYSGNGTVGRWFGTGTHYTTGTMGPSFAGNFTPLQGDFIRMTSSTSNILKQPMSALSVSAWLYLTATTGNGGISATGPGIVSNTNLNGWGVHVKGGYLYVLFYFSGTPFGTRYQFTQAPIPLNRWSFVTLTYDGALNTMAGYLNGNLLGTFSPPPGPTTASPAGTCTLLGGEPSLVNGCTYDPAEGLLPGRMDDLRVYNRVLSPSEIQKIYTAEYFTRYFYVDDVMRNGSGYIDPSGNIPDPSTEKITAVYSWPQLSIPRSFSMYLTRHVSRSVIQNDWSGGVEQIATTTSFYGFFPTSTNIDYATSTGSLFLQGY
jgi:type II secretory pathway pseudopilin PulG